MVSYTKLHKGDIIYPLPNIYVIILYHARIINM